MPTNTDTPLQAAIAKAQSMLPTLSPDERQEAEQLIAELLQSEEQQLEAADALLGVMKKDKAMLVESAENADRTTALSAIDQQLTTI